MEECDNTLDVDEAKKPIDTENEVKWNINYSGYVRRSNRWLSRWYIPSCYGG